MKTNNNNIFKGFAITMLIGLLMLALSVNHCQAQISFTDSGQRLGNGSSNDVALGDLDGDGDLDAFVINGQWNIEEPNEVWFNDGHGNFTASDQVFGNSKCGEVALADLDGDGDLDVFIGYYNYISGEPDQVWFNDGTGYFTDSGQRLGHRNGGVALADLDNDGDIDAFISNHVFSDGTNGGLKIWLNDSTGHFTDSGQDLGNGNHTSVSLGDVDGDGDIDALVTFNYGQAGNRIWLNDGHAQFTQGPLISTTFSADAKLRDLDGDGDLDIFLTHRGGNKIWLNDGAGHFTDSGQVLGNSETSAVGLGDLDGDGDPDAFVLNAVYQSARPNEIWINNGKGVFTDTGLRPGTNESYDVELGDLDGDGDLDAFVAITGPNKVWINNSTHVGTENLVVPQVSFSIMPNPVIDHATLSFDLEGSGHARIQIYNSLGQTVEKISDEVFPQGTHFIEWNAIKYSKGVYYAAFESKDNKSTIKLVIN
jgi:hypothetical protein